MTSHRRKLLVGGWIYFLQAVALVMGLGGIALVALNPDSILLSAVGTSVAFVGWVGVLTGLYFVGHSVSE